MVRILMHGCGGKMGRMISAMAQDEAGAEIAAGVDAYNTEGFSYPVFSRIGDCSEQVDVVIDFSNAEAVDGVIDYCLEKNVALVLCTTGLSQAQLDKVQQACTRIAVLRSANMSLGINLLMKMLKEAAAKLMPAGYDCEIVEKHHRQKVDAPSGTALALADSINEEFGNEYTYVYDRSTRREKRSDKEIGISAVRGGTIVGEHDVLFAGPDEVIRFSHTAFSRGVFAKGALEAAKFMNGKPAGMYSMEDVLA